MVLDTNALIHPLKGIGNVRERLVKTDPAQVAVTAVTVYEIEYGTVRSTNPEARRRKLHWVMSVVATLPFGRRAAERAAQIELEREKRGETIGRLDLTIAGTALACGCKLVTKNTREFSRVPD